MVVEPKVEKPSMPVVEIDTAVTPSLHPQNVLSLPDYGEDTAPAVSVVVDALRSAYDGLSDVHKARAAAEKDPTLTPAARLLKVASFGEQHQNAITRKFDSARANLLKAVSAIDSSLNEPLKLRSERPGVASEVRAHVKGLTASQREQWFNDRQKEGDYESLEIILGAPGYLSNVSSEERAVRTRFYHEMRHPVEAKRLRVMKAALDLIERRGPLVWGELEKAVGASPVKVQKLREATTEAEKAFLMRDKSAA